MNIGKALDISNWSGEVPLSKARAAKTLGYDLVIVGTQNQLITSQQLDVFEEAGFARHAYTYFRFDRDPIEQTEAGIDALGGRAVGISWLDWEDDTAERLTERATVDFIRAAHNYCIGKVTTGLYTRPNWWQRQTADSQEFKDFKLWLATADTVGDLSYNTPFGGWTGPWMEQFAFDQDVAGIHCDLNAYDRAETPPPPVDPEPEPELPTINRVYAHLEAIRINADAAQELLRMK